MASRKRLEWTFRRAAGGGLLSCAFRAFAGPGRSLVGEVIRGEFPQLPGDGAAQIVDDGFKQGSRALRSIPADGDGIFSSARPGS